MTRSLSDYMVKFSVQQVLRDPDPDDIAVPIVGDILFIERGIDSCCLETEVELRIGYVRAFYVPVGECDEQEISVFDAFDAVSAEMASCYEALFDGETFKESVEEQFHDVVSPDVLYVDAIEILPEHRGQGLGLAVLRKLIQGFGPSMGLVAVLPHPLNSFETDDWIARMRMGQFPKGLEEAKGRLRRYYGRLGFEQVGDSDVLALCTSNRLPPLDKLCPSLV